MIATLRERLRPPEEPDAGITLVEMVVAMVIFGIIGAMASTWFISTTRTSAWTNAHTDDLMSAQQAMDRLSRDIRVAIAVSDSSPAVASGSKGNDLSIYTNVGTEAAPRLVRWYVQTSGSVKTLIRSEIRGVYAGGAWSWPAGSAIDTMTTGVLDDNAPPIFQYLDASADNVSGLCSDTPVPSPCATPLPAGTSALSDANRAVVTSIEVNLRIATRAKSSRVPVITRTRVYMPNAGQVTGFK